MSVTRIDGNAGALALASALVCALVGCARGLPPEQPRAALYRDLERLVTLRAAAGWQIDRYEYQALLPTALMSVCRVSDEHRRGLESWLGQRIHALGGPVDVAFRTRGRDLGRVSELLRLTRIRDLLRAALDSADADCPFWLEPDAEFAGRQISDDRWQISLGGGGKGVLVTQDGRRDLQFGGSGRLLVGRNLGSRLALYGGLDVGGLASVPRTPDGRRTSLLVTVDLAAPVVLRYRMTNSYLEVEAGYLAYATEEDWRDLSHGVHLGAAFGARTARARWFFPGVAFGIAYDQVNDHGSPRHALKMGFRVAFDIDL
jgi:hypothetical protein